jgi:hypothetical protein
VVNKRDECGCHHGCDETFTACTRPCRWPSCLTPEEDAALTEALRREWGSMIVGRCTVVYRQHPETGMAQLVHEDGTHHTPAIDPRCR